MVDEESHNHHLPTSFGMKLPEILGLVVFIVAYIWLRITVTETQPLIVAVVGFAIALWMIMRPTEWASEGLQMLAKKLGIGTYAAGVIGSIMANLPELVLAAFLIIGGESELAILTVLMVAGANTLLFGIVVVKNGRKAGGEINVPVTTLKYESELMIFAFITALILFVFNFAEEQIQLANASTGLSSISIPIFFSIGSAAIYIFYLYFLATDQDLNPEYSEEELEHMKTDPALKVGNIVKFLLFGVVGIVVAGELLANGAELMITAAEHQGYEIPIAVVALIVGGLGSLPEWAIAFKAGDDLELVFGSVLSSISATILFMLSLVIIFMDLTVEGGFELDPFALVQIVLSGLILMFVYLLLKDDEKLDVFEGIGIIILQLIGFVIFTSIK